MNKILIGSNKSENIDNKTFFVQLLTANDTLAILRSDHFLHIQIELPEEINNSQIRFLMHTGRLLTSKGQIVINGSKSSVGKVKAILKNLGLFIGTETQEQVVYNKSSSQPKVENTTQSKLSIGFKNLAQEQEQIDEDELLKNENIKIEKTSTGGCADKPRACANCNCGRKKDEPLPSKQELVQSVNEGNPVSGCGKCYLGDSFRCATCPYAGLPAFKPGDKLKLDDNSKVIVQTGPTIVQNGKVKIEI